MEEQKKINTTWKERYEALKLSVRWTYKSSPLLTIILFVVTVLTGLLVIVEPYIFKLIIDYLTGSEKLNLADRIGLGIVGILVVYGVARVFQGILWDIQLIIKRIHGQRLDRYVAKEMMNKVSSLDAVYFEDPEYYNNLMKADQNIWRITDIFWQFTFLTGQIVSLLVIVSALATFDWRIVGIIILGALPGILLFSKSTKIYWGIFDSSSPISRQASYYQEMMMRRPEAVKEIRLFGLKNYFLERFDSLMETFLKKQNKAAFYQFIFSFFMVIIEGFLSILAAWLVVIGFQNGNISIGDVAFFWALLFQFAGHTRWIVRLISDINTSATFTTYFVKILKFKSQIVEVGKPLKFPRKLGKGIEFRNVSFKYPRAKEFALKNVNFIIQPGESVALVGENGSGKTTLIKLLCRLYDVSGGEILIDGRNIKEYSLDELYENLGVIFQDFMKYEALVSENIGFGKLRNLRAREKIHRASVKSESWEFIKDLDRQYKTHLGKTLKEEGKELSVGQWQKIALARAFFRNAQVLILDEPTAAVDAKTEYKIFQRFEELTKNKTTFLISHRFSTVRMARKIMFIKKGKIIEQGSHRELLNRNGEYAKMFKLQAEGYRY